MQLTHTVGVCHLVNPRVSLSLCLPGCIPGTAFGQKAAASAIRARPAAARTMVTEATSAPAPLLFRQLFDSGSSTFTYILADSASREAVMIDPVLEQVDRDLGLLEELQLHLLYAINTHCHADHVTGTGEIKKRLKSVRSGISEASGAQADVLYAPGDTISFGSQTLQVLPTPGHTNGCVCYYSRADGGRVFTGDTLLIRGCGRTDFQEGSAERLYDSVHSQLFSLPDSTAVYPAHDYKGRTSSTVGEEKQHNLRLTKSKEDFITIMANLGLPYPKKIDEAVPANMVCGIHSG